MKQPSQNRSRNGRRGRVPAWSIAAVMAAGAWGAEEAAPAGETPAPETKPAAKEEPKEEPAKTEADYRNWFTVGIGGTVINGRSSAYQQRYGLPDGVFGGVQDFHYEQDVGKKGALFKVDGRGIFDNHDYGLQLELSQPDKGFVRFGYTEFREWYDGGGGYFPGTGPGQVPLWFNLYDPTLGVDLSRLTFEAGLRLPKVPKFTIRYTRETRNGTKNSTIWGQSYVDASRNEIRSITPTYLGIDEARNILVADIAHTLGKTDLGVGFRFQANDQNNTRNEWNFPGQPGSAHVTQRDQNSSDMYSGYGYASSRLSKKVQLSAGYSFMTVDTDVSGYRVYGTVYDPDLAQRLPNPGTFQALTGDSSLYQNLMSVNLLYTPKESWAIVPSLRVDQRQWDGTSSFGQPAQPFTPTPYLMNSSRGLLDVAGDLEVRYSGVTNWTYYVRGTWTEGSGDLQEQVNNLATGAVALQRLTDDNRFWQKYAAGANWYPIRKLTLGAEVYFKMRDNTYDTSVDSTSNLPGSSSRYPAYLQAVNSTTEDINFHVAWRPLPSLSLVGRYDFQLTTIDSQAAYLSSVQAAETTSQILSANATWNATTRFYLLGGMSYVWDATDSPADEITRAIQTAANNYWTANAGVGYVLDQKTDVEAQYYIYSADNFVDNSAFGMPYGASAVDQGVTVGLSRRLNPRTRVSLRYGFFHSDNPTSGNNLNYTANLVFASVQYRF